LIGHLVNLQIKGECEECDGRQRMLSAGRRVHYPFLIDQKSVGWLAEKNTPDEKDVERRKSDGDYELAMPAG